MCVCVCVCVCLIVCDLETSTKWNVVPQKVKPTRACDSLQHIQVKVTQCHYRPRVAQRVPGSYGSQIT
jgi:hypothetical protein